MKQTFSKAERLSSRKLIDELFSKGHSFNVFPFRCLWKHHSLGNLPSIQVAITVPKRNFKKAVDRNKLKRRIREAWRKNKHLLLFPAPDTPDKAALILVFVSRESLSYKEIEQKIILLLQRFPKEYETHVFKERGNQE